MTLEDLKRVQEIDTELLFMIDDICQKYHIEYYLFYGTLLGCIRHEGPIPWDDDVDIAMTRENYKQFLNVVYNEIDGSRYVVKLMGSGSADYVTEIKIGKLNTTYCMPGTENIDIMNHVQLDIFCLDYAKKMSKKQWNLKIKLWKLLRLTGLNGSEKKLLQMMIEQSASHFKWVYKCGLSFLHLMRALVGEKNIERIGYHLFVDEKKKSNMFAVAGEASIWPKNLFSVETKKYAGRYLSVPTGYDEILRIEYGEYMVFPPKEERYRKHFDKIVFKEEIIKDGMSEFAI